MTTPEEAFIAFVKQQAAIFGEQELSDSEIARQCFFAGVIYAEQKYRELDCPECGYKLTQWPSRAKIEIKTKRTDDNT